MMVRIIGSCKDEVRYGSKENLILPFGFEEIRGRWAVWLTVSMAPKIMVSYGLSYIQLDLVVVQSQGWKTCCLHNPRR